MLVLHDQVSLVGKKGRDILYNKSYTPNINLNTTVWSVPYPEQKFTQKIDKVSMCSESVVSECHETSLVKINNCANDIICMLEFNHISGSEFNDIYNIINNKLYNHS